MPKSRLHDLVSGKQPEPATKGETMVWGADEWQAQTALDVPEAVKQDSRYKGMRFRWLHPSVISQRGYRKWKVVNIEGNPDELDSGFGDSHGRQTDTVVRRGDLILAYMPERMARARESYYSRMNSPEEFQRKTKEELSEALEKRRVGMIGTVFGGLHRKRKRQIYDMGIGKSE